MANKRKYARTSEEAANATKYECTKRKCKWQGTNSEKIHKTGSYHLTCLKCGNNEFYLLL